LRIDPTFRPRRARHWLRPGGPWQSGTLDDLFADADRVARVAGGLRAAGVGRRDAVSWRLPNVESSVVLFRACWRLGAVAVPLHPRGGDAVVPALHVDTLPEGAPVPLAASVARPSDPAVVLHTSGSTAAPKGVIHTHRGLRYKAETMVRAHGLHRDDVVLMPAPLSHISGLLNGVLVPAAAGMRSVLAAAWDPDDALDVIERERVSFMIGPPTFFVDLLAASSFDTHRVASLRIVSCGGAGVTPAFVSEATDRLGAAVKRTYGSTEAPTITTWQPGDPTHRARETDGRVTGEAEVRLDADGEVLVRGPEVCCGYTDPAANEEAFDRGGWFRTGDVGTLDDGWLTVTGRKKDVIIRGGENIAVGAVEAALEAHPAVRQAVVVGVPDARLGERVCAFVVCRPGRTFDVAEAQRWFADRGLPRFTTPEQVVLVDAVPTMASGKPDRAALRALV
jgi:cyclohexanecarboxylate-CoA ligase